MGCFDDTEINSSKLTLIQGDTFNVNITIDDNINVSKVIFSCKKLDIVKELTYNTTLTAWILNIPSSETECFTPCTADYDITLKFNTNEVYTAIYKNQLIIYPKTNEIC